MKPKPISDNRALLLVSTISLLISLLTLAISAPGAGADFKIYCAAVEAYDQGADPYQVSNTSKLSGSPNSFVYPPITLPIFRGLCLFPVPWSHYTVWSIFLILSIALLRSITKSKYTTTIYCTALVFGGLLSTQSAYRTGNIGPVELFLSCLFIKFLVQSKPLYAGLSISLLTFVKIVHGLIPVVVSLYFLKSLGCKVLWGSLLGLVVLLLISYGIFPDNQAQQIRQILGLIPQQHSPIRETGGIGNQAIYFVIKDGVTIASKSLLGCALISLLIFLPLTAIFHRAYSRLVKTTNSEKYTERLMLVVLFATIMMPRLKPYSMIIMIPPVFLLSHTSSAGHKIVLLLVAVMLPLVGEITARIYGISADPETLSGYLYAYKGMISILITIAFILYQPKLEEVPH